VIQSLIAVVTVVVFKYEGIHRQTDTVSATHLILMRTLHMNEDLQLSLTNPRDALHHGERAANK